MRYFCWWCSRYWEGPPVPGVIGRWLKASFSVDGGSCLCPECRLRLDVGVIERRLIP